jgi:hypothetical protein
MGMNWDYETHCIPDVAINDPEGLKMRLNAWGAQGFELVSAVRSAYGTTFIFKRPRDDA